MAGDWIPIGNKTPRCQEIVRIAGRSKRSRRETFAILAEFWIWVVEQTDTGLLEGYTLDDLPNAVDGTDAAFWKAVEAEQWVVQQPDGLFVPDNTETPFISKGSRARLLKARRDADYKNRLAEEASTCASTTASTSPSTCASTKTTSGASSTAPPTVTVTVTETERGSDKNQKRSEPRKALIGERPPNGESDRSDLLFSASEEEVANATPLVASLFDRMAYTGDDGAIVWKLAILSRRGGIAENWLHDAANGVAECNAAKPPAYFAKVAASHLLHGITRHDVDAIKLPKGFKGKPPPRSEPLAEVLQLSEAFKPNGKARA